MRHIFTGWWLSRWQRPVPCLWLCLVVVGKRFWERIFYLLLFLIIITFFNLHVSCRGLGLPSYEIHLWIHYIYIIIYIPYIYLYWIYVTITRMYSFARYFMKLRLDLSEDKTVMYIYRKKRRTGSLSSFSCLTNRFSKENSKHCVYGYMRLYLIIIL